MIGVSSSHLIEVITAMLCIHMLYGKKKVFNLPAVIVICMDLMVYRVIKAHGIPAYSNIVVYIALIIYSVWLLDSSVKELVVNTVLLVINIGCLQIVAILPTVYIFTKAEIEADISLVCNLAVLVFTLLIDRFIGYANIKRYVLSQKGLTTIIASVCMVSVVYGLFSIRITGTSSAIALLWVVVLCSILCITCYQWLRQKELTREREIDLQVYELYYDSFQALLLELRARQHDFKNHIQAIRNQHYVCKDYDSLVQAQCAYCEEIVGDDKFAGLLGCENSIIAGFLYGKFAEIEKKGISIKYVVSVFSHQYPVPLYVIIETLGILLDNAAEYVCGREDAGIEIDLYESASSLCIKVMNPIEKLSVVEFMNYFEVNKSTKGQGRGIGLAKIRQYSEKYKWDVIVDMDEGYDKNKLIMKVIIPTDRQIEEDFL